MTQCRDCIMQLVCMIYKKGTDSKTYPITCPACGRKRLFYIYPNQCEEEKIYSLPCYYCLAMIPIGGVGSLSRYRKLQHDSRS